VDNMLSIRGNSSFSMDPHTHFLSHRVSHKDNGNEGSKGDAIGNLACQQSFVCQRSMDFPYQP
jgi:hypothetical protein